MDYPALTLRKNSEHAVRNGHPWIFSGAVAKKPEANPGDIVDVLDAQERFVCRGFYNPRAMIRVRALTRNPNEPIDEHFVATRLAQAVRLRKRAGIHSQTDAMRLVHGESDGLPGLIVDDYAGFLVLQIHTLGIQKIKEIVLDVLEKQLIPKGIYERSDVGTRRAEGLTDRPTGVLRGERPPEFVEVKEGDVRLFVDLYRGQKTGFFIDQRPNRLQVQQLADNADVLNLFAYSSAFSAHALHGGARSVLDVDISQRAPYAARQNIQNNRSHNAIHRYVVADAFPFIDQLATHGPRYDMVIVDPPSLVRKRDRNQVKRAMGVYTKLNRNAMRTVRDGGLLVTASCSTPISQEDFFEVVRRAATSARVQTRLLSYNLHAADHPVDPNFPDGRYLKCAITQVWR
ncbi:MAG: class I SAM-dependent rRNA methyltransferase [Candidatus Latescibacterota bacterium]|nr:class I SAM-dependent rRNA methyltransferase [Candidatus Latescibacterota bacterium]